ncbi:MAG: LuxE/PaaK family acyltransferase [Longimicrobiales bacterium]
MPPADLHATVRAALRTPADAAPAEADFDALALRIFEHQFELNSPFRAYCERRGRTPSSISHWTEIPPVPAAAFREVSLVAGDPHDARVVFRTSGTTGGAARRGEHYVIDPSIYEASLLPTFTAYLLPDGARPDMLALIPPRPQMPDSSLAYMIDVVMRSVGGSNSAYAVDAEKGIDHDAAMAWLTAAADGERPVCLLGTSFSFVHLIDALKDGGRSFHLPAGSRLMDTGGYKGRSREVPAEELRTMYGTYLGIESAYCINEYGMTELCSQYYDATLHDAVRGAADRPRRKKGPPWLRARVLDPETLEPLPAGAVGILAHYDLANVDSVIGVLTEDLGHEVDDGFVVLGRARDATPRGCSIALDDLLSASRDRQ